MSTYSAPLSPRRKGSGAGKNKGARPRSMWRRGPAPAGAQPESSSHHPVYPPTPCPAAWRLLLPDQLKVTGKGPAEAEGGTAQKIRALQTSVTLLLAGLIPLSRCRRGRAAAWNLISRSIAALRRKQMGHRELKCRFPASVPIQALTVKYFNKCFNLYDFGGQTK